MTWEIARAEAERILDDPLYWFPVRHHSPNVARHLRAALRARRPKLVLMEGPPEATELVKFVVDKKTKPPVAIYSSYRDDGDVLGLAGIVTPAKDVPARFASWYPLLPYSPEYVAMVTAAEIGAPVVFIDLPHYARIRPRTASPLLPGGPAPSSEAPPTDTAPDDGATLLAASDFYRRLAEAAGYKTFTEAWDALFEVGERHADFEAFRRDLAWFCAAARVTTPKDRMEHDGTLARERRMWRTIQTELEARKLVAGDVMVVTGGFHMFLDRADPNPPPAVPPGTVYTTVAPYSYWRTSELSGYGAGNRAPRYYERLWGAFESGAGPDGAMVDHVCAVLHQGRKAGEALSAADAVSIAHATRLLATLRGRPHPTLDDITDAVVTCCCKGDPREEGVQLLEAIHEAGVGTAVGKVTQALGRLPLVHDFYTQLEELDLRDVTGKDKRGKLTLDKREALGQRRSAFLHRLVELEVPLAELERTPVGSGAIFKEVWRTAWSPEVEDALIGKNLYGDRVESAALAKLEEELAREPGNAAATTQRWRRAVDMELPGLALRLEESCGAAIDVDKRLASLARAHTDLVVLERHASLRQLRSDVLADLAVRAFRRACLAIPDAADVPEEEQPEVLDALRVLAEAVLGGGDTDRELFGINARAAANLTESPFLRGVFLGLLAEIREETPASLAAHVVAYANARPEQVVQAGAFLDGVLAMSRTSLTLGAEPLVAAIDELLRAADWDTFVAMVPKLRGAFERLHRRQRESFASQVAERYGLTDTQAVTRLDTSVGAALALAAVDTRVAAICAEWGL